MFSSIEYYLECSDSESDNYNLKRQQLQKRKKLRQDSNIFDLPSELSFFFGMHHDRNPFMGHKRNFNESVLSITQKGPYLEKTFVKKDGTIGKFLTFAVGYPYQIQSQIYRNFSLNMPQQMQFQENNSSPKFIQDYSWFSRNINNEQMCCNIPTERVENTEKVIPTKRISKKKKKNASKMLVNDYFTNPDLKFEDSSKYIPTAELNPYFRKYNSQLSIQENSQKLSNKKSRKRKHNDLDYRDRDIVQNIQFVGENWNTERNFSGGQDCVTEPNYSRECINSPARDIREKSDEKLLQIWQEDIVQSKKKKIQPKRIDHPTSNFLENRNQLENSLIAPFQQVDTNINSKKQNYAEDKETARMKKLKKSKNVVEFSSVLDNPNCKDVICKMSSRLSMIEKPVSKLNNLFQNGLDPKISQDFKNCEDMMSSIKDEIHVLRITFNNFLAMCMEREKNLSNNIQSPITEKIHSPVFRNEKIINDIPGQVHLTPSEFLFYLTEYESPLSDTFSPLNSVKTTGNKRITKPSRVTATKPREIYIPSNKKDVECYKRYRALKLQKQLPLERVYKFIEECCFDVFKSKENSTKCGITSFPRKTGGMEAIDDITNTMIDYETFKRKYSSSYQKKISPKILKHAHQQSTIIFHNTNEDRNKKQIKKLSKLALRRVPIFKQF